MNRIIKALGLVALLVALAAVPTMAQTDTTPSTVQLSMTVTESISLSVDQTQINFTYNGAAGTGTADRNIKVTLSGNFGAGHTAIADFAWLSSATAALGGPANIPSSQFFQSVNGGTAGACNHNPTDFSGMLFGNNPNFGVTGATCSPIFTQAAPTGAFSHQDTITYSLQGLNTNLPAGTYTGVLNVEGILW